MRVSKKTLFIGTPIVLLIVVAIIVSAKNTDTYESDHDPNKAALGLISNPSSDDADGDGDGLKDWEETLWGTDARNPDSDKDGTPDGEEVRRGRDPLVPGPDDAFQDKEKIAEVVKQSESFAKLNATERFGQDLFAKYLLIKQTGGQTSAESDESLIKSSVESISLNQKTKIYSGFSFISSPDNSTEATKQYANLLIEILRSTSVKSAENELVLLNRYTQSEGSDTSGLKKLAEISIGYQEIAENYSKMTIPSDFLSLHTELTNTASALSTDIDAMSKAEADPVLAVAGIGQYNKDSEKILTILKSISATLKQKGIVFNTSEPGSAFFRSL